MKKNLNYAYGLNMTMLALSAIPALSQNIQNKPKKPNILFIAVDDLKPVLGCYGDNLIRTPNIDRIAKNGTVFLNNQCQQAVSGPTRASLLTGKRPDYTKVWDLKTLIRDMNPDILTLPQYLKSQGYITCGVGKVFDNRSVDVYQDKDSWSVPYYRVEAKYFSAKYGLPAMNFYQNPETKELAVKYYKEAADKGLKGSDAFKYVTKYVNPSVECADVPDNAYTDGTMALKAKDVLIGLNKSNNPFFFAVGFIKPHLPFVAPKKYWDMYKREEMPVAEFQGHAKNSPDFAYHNSSELLAYTDIPPLVSFTDHKPGIGLPPNKQKELIHAYHAAVSYTDAQIGILLNTLDSLGMLENTIIVLWGDHGWHLGDHDLWCKHTNFEQATRAPLLISAPWIKPSRTKSVSEFVDVFPTLCDLIGITIPDNLDGKSLVPVMKDPSKSVKDIAVSQYPRGNNMMGYSIRTEQYRYTIWMKNDFRSYQPFAKELIAGSELYDYKLDPNETVNVVNDEKYLSVSREMYGKMTQFLKTQVSRK
jgi:iduronate 2-sulfatase